MTLRSFYRFVFLVAALSVSACQKNDPVPTTGNLTLTFTYDSAYAGYSLFTEQGWHTRVTTGTGNPLRSGTFLRLPAPPARVSTAVSFNDLNAGNYVFVVATATAQSVQVTAGKTMALTFSL